MTFCSNAKSQLNADSCMDNRLRPCEHISLMHPSHIFIVGTYSRVVRERESAISSARREVTVFSIAKQALFCTSNFALDRVFGGRLQNNDCRNYVVSVTARSRLGMALYTLGKITAKCKIRLRNKAHRICLMSAMHRNPSLDPLWMRQTHPNFVRLLEKLYLVFCSSSSC
jgi:hypothetical protein